MGLTPGQERCVNTLDRSLVVAAGAGSGKTFTLTRRVVHAFEEGFVQDIGQVMAITFTRKAAGELKSRIKAALRACGRTDQALKVDAAWISTIHGMCARILRAHAIKLGIDPGFAVVEGADAARMMDQAIDDALTEARLSMPEQTAALFREYPASTQGFGGTSVERMLARMVQQASADPRGADAFVIPESRMQPCFALEQMVETISGIQELAAAQKRNATRDKWLDQSEGILDGLREGLSEGENDPIAVLRLMAPIKLNKQFGDAEYKAAVDDARMAVDGCAIGLRLQSASGHLQTLSAIARDACARYSQLKRQAGALDNNDLLVQAAGALKGNPRIAAQYADMFKLIMVDEFQDTDQLQVDMVKCLAGAECERLCTVGDAQQSIYRFRGADVSVYRRHLATVEARDPSAVIRLPDNFRSHGDILAFVERVFARPSMFGGEFMHLDASRMPEDGVHPAALAAPRIMVQHTCAPSKGVTSEEVLQAAAERIAGHFAHLRAEGCPASDMVLLLGVMTHAGAYAQALRDAGLPCVIAGGTVFSDAPETQAVADAVRVLADPHDTRALYLLLAGPFFQLEAADFLELATRRDEQGGLHRRGIDEGLRELARQQEAAATQAAGTLPARLACAVRVVSDALRDAAILPASRLVRRMALDSGWLSRLQAQGPEGLASAGNVLKALRILAQEEAAGGYGPAQLAVRYGALLQSLKEGPGALSAGDGDFVRIMTIHASKGLEFPVVAVADLEGRAPSGKLLAENVDGSIYLSLDLDRTGAALGGAADPAGAQSRAAFEAAFDEGIDEGGLAEVLWRGATAFSQRAALSLRSDMGEREERKRLLYVALTRARESLVVSIRGKCSAKNPLGLPSDLMAETARSLGYGEDAAVPDRASFDFGGEHPAIVERILLEPEGEDGAAPTAEVLPEMQGGTAPAQGEEPFAIALPDEGMALERTPMRLAHRGVFSYSSIADASHEGDLLQRLVQSYAVGLPDDADERGEDAGAFDDGVSPWAAIADDSYWDGDGGIGAAPFAADADKATDLGTAFHRLAQYAVCARGAGEALAMPPDARIDALARTCSLGGEARIRLDAALGRWFASDIAVSMAEFRDLRAEVPFFIRLQAEGVPAPGMYLEGEIDLLALSEGGKSARVVDYKTGGSDDESAHRLARKHVLQAACYAYALLREGVQEVDAAFVRVERPSAFDPSQPQVVRFRFCADDIDDLERAIVSVAARAASG